MKYLHNYVELLVEIFYNQIQHEQHAGNRHVYTNFIVLENYHGRLPYSPDIYLLENA